jgi:hypothetical protein
MLELPIDGIEHRFLLKPREVCEMLFRRSGIANPVRHWSNATMRVTETEEVLPRGVTWRDFWQSLMKVADW